MSYADLTDRFLRYTAIDTRTNLHNADLPSSEGQRELAQLLVAEMRQLGLQDCFLLDNAICGGSVPANAEGFAPVSLFAHLDTAPELPGNTKAQLVKNYQGGDISVSPQVTIVAADEPDLALFHGSDIVVTSGDTLLGADNKAAIAEIVTFAAYLLANPSLPHGEVQLIFLPDEEKGLLGAQALDMSLVKGDYGICLDIGKIGSYALENWWAARATVSFQGVSAHPGGAKGKLVNSLLQLNAFVARLPADQRPETTEKQQGFFFLNSVVGDANSSRMTIHLRDFRHEGLEERKQLLYQLAADYPGCQLDMQDCYNNCGELLQRCPEMLAKVERGLKHLGISPRPRSMRGGFDGAVLCLKGLTTLNLSSGGYNAHSVKEFLPIAAAERAIDLLGFLVADLQPVASDKQPPAH